MRTESRLLFRFVVPAPPVVGATAAVDDVAELILQGPVGLDGVVVGLMGGGATLMVGVDAHSPLSGSILGIL